MIKVGITGCGQMGDVHLKIVNNMKNVRVVGVADHGYILTKKVYSF